MYPQTPATDGRNVAPENGAPPQTLIVGLAGAQHLPQPTLVADLRTNHAGESGAVMIYGGILAVTRDVGVRHFAQEHLATEARHLAQIEPLLALRQRSRLLPLWRAATKPPRPLPWAGVRLPWHCARGSGRSARVRAWP